VWLEEFEFTVEDEIVEQFMSIKILVRLILDLEDMVGVYSAHDIPTLLDEMDERIAELTGASGEEAARLSEEEIGDAEEGEDSSKSFISHWHPLAQDREIEIHSLSHRAMMTLATGRT